MNKLKKIKENFEGCFDVKYRDIKTILGDYFNEVKKSYIYSFTFNSTVF